MKPDTNYQLHSDSDDQSGAVTTPPDDQQGSQLEIPSKYNQAQNPTAAQPTSVPWYLQPLTKTTNSPLTTTQTRPYVPRQPLPSMQEPQSQPVPQQQPVSSAPTEPASTDQPPQVIQAPPLSPFRSRPQPAVPPAHAVSQDAQYQTFRPPTQSPYQQPTPSASPRPFSQFGTPSYALPARDAQPKKTKKLRPFILIALGLLLVVGITAGLFALWRNNNTSPAGTTPASVVSAEDRFYKAIENHFSTSNIHQVYTQTTSGIDTSTIKLDTTSNFSDPAAPKSLIKYELDTGEGESATSGAGELVVVDTNEYYGKLTKPVLFYDGADGKKPKENQWYAVATADSIGEMLVDPLSARSSINTVLGEIPVGNFSEATRRELIDFVKSKNVYKIKTSKDVTVDGKKMTQYSVEMNVDLLNELNGKIITALGKNPDDSTVKFTKSDSQQTDVWVSHDTSKVVRIKIDRETKAVGRDGSVKESTNLTIDYPNGTSTIARPQGAVAGSWLGG
jgi:hypothetical protein